MQVITPLSPISDSWFLLETTREDRWTDHFFRVLAASVAAVFPTRSLPQLLPMPASVLLAPSSCLELTFYFSFDVRKMNIRCQTGLLYSLADGFAPFL